MRSELVMRAVAVLACATTLSLFSTIAAYAAVNIVPLKWDGTFCASSACQGIALAHDTKISRVHVARLPAKPS